MSGISDRSTSSHSSHLFLQYVAAALLLLLNASAFAADSPLIVYAESSAVDSRLVETDSGTSVEGYSSELVRHLLAQTGRSAEIRVVPWPRLMNRLQTEPNVLGFNMTRTPEREELFHWIGEIRPVTFHLWGLAERRDELPDTLEAARDFRISAYRNDVVEQYLLRNNFSNLVYVSENYDSIAMLQRQRIDLLPYSEIAMADLKSRNESLRNQLVPIIALEEVSTAHYFVMSKNSDPELVQELTTAYQRILASGARDEILGSSLP